MNSRLTWSQSCSGPASGCSTESTPTGSSRSRCSTLRSPRTSATGGRGEETIFGLGRWLAPDDLEADRARGRLVAGGVGGREHGAVRSRLQGLPADATAERHAVRPLVGRTAQRADGDVARAALRPAQLGSGLHTAPALAL